MAALGSHLGFQKLAISLQRKQIYRMVFFLNDICTFSSNVIVILVGRTCLAVEEKMNMLISTFTKKKTIFVLIFLQMYPIVPCSKLYESRFFIFTQFWGENVIERGTC